MRRRFFLLLLLSFQGFLSQAQLPDPVSKIKVLFLYNFTKYIEWPQEYKQGDFIIGILGSSDDNLKKELDKLAQTKKAGTQNIVIKTFASANEIQRCHVIFIAEPKSYLLAEVVTKCKTKSTLIITEKVGLAQKGSAINFVVKDNKQHFELNKTNIQKYNLNVSSSLLSLGIVVN